MSTAETNAAAGGYPGYQTIKTKSRDVYCSSTKMKSHAEGNEWVAACMAANGIQASDIKSVEIAASQPKGAIIWP